MVDVSDVVGQEYSSKEKSEEVLSESANAVNTMRFAIWLLLILYCIPIFVGLLCLATVNLINSGGDQTALLRWFVSYAGHGNGSLWLVHKALLPLIGGFAPLAFRSKDSARSAHRLMIMIVVAIGACIVLVAWIKEPNAIKSIGTIIGPDTSKVTADRISAFFDQVEEILGMYLLVLFGVRVAS